MLKQPFISLIFASIFFCCNQQTASKEIVFICPHGAARSPIAAAYFNKMATEQQLNYHATFKGTEPGKTLSTRTVEGLTDEGIDIKGWKPTLVSKNDINNAYKVITFDCEVPMKNSSALEEQWDGTPSPSKEYDDYTNLIKTKVKELIENLPKD